MRIKIFSIEWLLGTSWLGVGQNQLPDTNNQIPTSNSGAGTGSGYAIAGC